MSATQIVETENATASSNNATGFGLARRLLPLRIATFLGGLAVWVPVEKLFMNEIGFTPASVGVLAAVYAGIVPFIEIPPGILADRGSRRGVLVIGYVALSAGAGICGVSDNVPTYLVSALALGVFFAMRSGTLESLVYDTVLEETKTATCSNGTSGASSSPRASPSWSAPWPAG